MDTFTQGYALLIGIDDHNEITYSLPDVGKDIKALAEVLTSRDRCAYPTDHVRVLRGKDATRAAILDGLTWLQEQLAADETGNATAVVYYSGHGWRNTAAAAATYYLIPYDTQIGATGPKASTAIRADEFSEEILALPAKRLLVVLDCCHAAGLDVKALGTFAPAAPPVHLILPAAGKGPDALGGDGKGIEQLAAGRGRAILSSSQSDEKSYIRTDRAMSIFTYHLIGALTGHAQPQQGADDVLVSDILSYVHRHVPASAHEQYQRPQHPDYKLTGNFAVALLLGGKGLPAGQPAPDPLEPPPVPPVTNQATNTGSGSIVQGGGVAAGERGIAIGGNATGNQFITGDNNRTTNVNTGGGTYVDGSVHTGGGDFVGRNKNTYHNTTFDQSGQTVGGNQTNIAGDVNTGGGAFNSGFMGTSQPDLAAQLRQLRTAVNQAGAQRLLDEDSVIDAEGALRKAIRQAEQPAPDRQAIRSHLLTAQEIVQNAGGAGHLVGQIAGMVGALG